MDKQLPALLRYSLIFASTAFICSALAYYLDPTGFICGVLAIVIYREMEVTNEDKYSRNRKHQAS